MTLCTSIRAAIAMGLFAIALPALAESTTTTAFSVEGNAVPGQQVVIHAVVTGKHLAWVPPTAVHGGQVQITLNGEIVLSVESDFHNSSGIGPGQCIPDPTFTYCLTYKFTAAQTNVDFPLILPEGPSTYTIGVKYTGDTDSHSSEAPAQVLIPVHPGAIPGALSILLD